MTNAAIVSMPRLEPLDRRHELAVVRGLAPNPFPVRPWPADAHCFRREISERDEPALELRRDAQAVPAADRRHNDGRHKCRVRRQAVVVGDLLLERASLRELRHRPCDAVGETAADDRVTDERRQLPPFGGEIEVVPERVGVHASDMEIREEPDGRHRERNVEAGELDCGMLSVREVPSPLGQGRPVIVAQLEPMDLDALKHRDRVTR